MTKPVLRVALSVASAAVCFANEVTAAAEAPLTPALGIHFVEGSSSTLIVERDGRMYLVDLAAQSVKATEIPQALPANPAHSSPASPQQTSSGSKVLLDGATIFKQNCAGCHGVDGRGLRTVGTPDLTNPKVQASLTNEEMIKTIETGRKGTPMPAWAGKLASSQIFAVASYERTLSPGNPEMARAAEAAKPKVYQPGDDLLVSLPTGRRLDRHGVYVNFTHRFALDPAFTKAARGGDLLGLDGFSLSSFGFGYGITKKLSASIYRSPTFIARPIQVMGAYNFLDEQDGQPLNAAFRVSLEGRNDFSRQFTENIEAIFSHSVTPRAQLYVVPTLSMNNRRLVQPSSELSRDIPSVPGHTSFALGFGGSLDIRPTVALVAEVIPTLAGGRALDIHRPAYSFGIQKKIWRHAFTLGVTNSPGTTVSQRSGTRAAYTGQPSADTPGGLVIGFDIMRQIH